MASRATSLLSRCIFLFIFITLFISPSFSQKCGTYQDNENQLYFYPDAIDMRTGSNPGRKSTLDFQGLRLQINQTVGSVQVVELDNNNIVFNWAPSSPKNCSSGCKLVMQNDGNFVMYFSDGSAIGTDTDNKGAYYARFSTTPPYLSVIHTNCTVLWPITTPISSPRTTTIRAATRSETGLVSAIASTRWKSHFGVNTHISQGWSSQMVLNFTTYLGAGAIRDSVPTSTQYSDFQKMNAIGVKLNVVLGAVANKSVVTQTVKSFSAFAANISGMLGSIEGFNEVNNFGFSYNGISSSNCSGYFQAMEDLYSLVKADSNLKNIPVYDLTGQEMCSGSGDPRVTSYSGRADYGNGHSYAYFGQQSVCIAGSKNQFLLSAANNYATWTDLSSFVMTETGYHTYLGAGSSPAGVTETAHSILIVNILLNGIKNGMHQTFIYEAWDERWTGYEGDQSYYGLFHNNKTTKPAARAIHFISELLNDDSTISSLATVNLTLDNLPIGSNYLLFQRSNGTLIFIIWNNAPVYDPVADTDLALSTTQVSLTLPYKTQIQVYDPYDTTANDQNPLSPKTTETESSSITFSFKGQAQIVSFSPDPSSSSSTTSSSASVISCSSFILLAFALLSF